MMRSYVKQMKEFVESVDEAESIPLVRRGQGTSQVDTHPSPTRRLYQAKDKKEYEKLMDAATHAMTQKMLGKFGVTGDYKKYTVEIEFKDEKSRKKFEKSFGIKESVDEAKQGELQQWEFPNERKAKQFLKDVENAGVAVGDLMQKNKKQVIIEILPGNPKVTDSAIAKYSAKNGGKRFNQGRSGPWSKTKRVGESVELDEKADLKGLSDDAKGLLASAINFASSDGGPYADVSNLDYFTPEAWADAMKFIKTNKSRMAKSAMKPYKELQNFFKESVELDEKRNKTDIPASPEMVKWIESGRAKILMSTDSTLGGHSQFVIVENPNTGSNQDKVLMFTISDPKRGRIKMFSFHGSHVNVKGAMKLAKNNKLVTGWIHNVD